MSVQTWFWNFFFYSFAGYLLERWYAWMTQAKNQARKCFLVLPLCPVYGLAMTAVLALPEALRQGPWLVVAGAVVTTAVEYVVHWAYEQFLNVRFWDYSAVQGNLHGRVCLPFTAVWGVLAAAAVWGIQPLLDWGIPRIPREFTLIAILLVTLDGLYTARVLRRLGRIPPAREWGKAA